MEGHRTSKVTSGSQEPRTSITTEKRDRQYQYKIEAGVSIALNLMGFVFGVYSVVDFYLRESYTEMPRDHYAKYIRYLAVVFFAIMMLCTRKLYKVGVPYLITFYGDLYSYDYIQRMSWFYTVLFSWGVAGYSCWAFFSSPSLV